MDRRTAIDFLKNKQVFFKSCEGFSEKEITDFIKEYYSENKILSGLKVYESGFRKISVSPGDALVFGKYFHHGANKDFYLPIFDHGQFRTDTIVLRLDSTFQTITISKKNGEINKTAPDTTNDFEIWEIELAIIYMDGNNIKIV